MKVSPEEIEKMYPVIEGGEDFTSMFEESQKKEAGSMKSATIVGINLEENFVFLSLGEKTENKLHIDEIKDSNGNILFKVGDTIPVHVSRTGRGFKISYKRALKIQLTEKEIDRLGDDFEGAVVEGVIIDRNKGGYVVEGSNKIEYFLPQNESWFPRPESVRLTRADREKYLNKSIKACVIDVKKSSFSIIISRRRYIQINDKIQKEGAKQLIESGLAYEGVVERISSYGLFIRIGNINGFVKRSELSHRSNTNVFLFNLGDVVQVKPISYDEERNTLELSIKALFDDPWEEIKNEIKVGYVIRVTVSNIESYGAFVDLGNDIEGFLHISEISWDKNVENINDFISVGQEIDVKIINIDSEERKLRVSLKQLEDGPFDVFMKNHKAGDVIKGKVVNLTTNGASISLFNKVSGFLSNRDAFWDKDKKCDQEFKIDDEIEVKIERIERETRRIYLNSKVFIKSPIDLFIEKYRIDDILKGKVIDIKEFGIFIRINEENVDALLRNEDFGELKKEDIKIQDEIECVLISVDKNLNKIKVSVRRLQKQKERQKLKEFNVDDKMTLGDKLGNIFQKNK